MDFCTKCGGQLNGERFCPNCGADVGAETNATNFASESSANVSNAGKKIAAVLVVAVVAILAVLLFSGRSYKKTTNDFINAAFKKYDAKKIVSLMPEALVKYTVKEEYDGDKKDMIEDYEEQLKLVKKAMKEEDIKASKISYKITDVDNLDKDDIKDIEEKYEDAKLHIKAAKEVEVEIKIPIKGEKEKESFTLTVVKVGNSWCILDLDDII